MKRAILTLLIAILIILSSSSVWAESQKMTEEEVIKFFDIYDLLQKEYPFKLDKGQLYDGALKGLVKSIDEYSDYYNYDEASDVYQSITGKFQGIGVYIKELETHLEVTGIIKGSPAEKVDIKKGDLIVSVGTKDIKDLKIGEAVKLIKGEKGTKVSLKIQRGEKFHTVICTRDEITVNPVSYEIKDGNIGYIKIDDFNINTSVNFNKALTSFDEKGVTKLILDLRDNPGGLLSSCVTVAGKLVPKGKIVSIRTVDGISEVYDSDLEKLKYKTVLLVNGHSASASEIVAGAMKDTKSAVLVGEKTFGKGVVQRLVPLKDGTLLKYTYAEYLTPKGKSINKIGVEPDYVVVNEYKDGELVEDLQLKKAFELLK